MFRQRKIISSFSKIYSLGKYRPNFKYKQQGLFSLKDSIAAFYTLDTFKKHNKKVDSGLKQLNKFVRENNFESAKQTFEKLKNTLTGKDLLKASNIYLKLIVQRNPEDGQNFVEEMIKNNISPNEFTLSTWMKGYCNRGEPEKAEEIFRNSKYQIYHNEVLYNMLIDAFAKKRKMEDSLRLFKEMQRNGFTPDATTYSSLISAFIKGGDLNFAIEIFNKMKSNGIKPDTVTYSSLIDGYSKKGDMNNAIEIFNKMKSNGLKPDTITYSSLIDGYCKQGDLNFAIEIFNKMKSNGIKPNTITYSTLIDGYCKQGEMNHAIKLLEQLKFDGLKPNTITYNSLIDGYCKQGDLNNETLQSNELNLI